MEDLAVQKGKGLSGELPSFTHAQGLIVLRLNGNALTGQLPELPSTVQEIRVQNNELHGSIPRGYGFLKQLHTFKAEGNKLSGGIPSGPPLPQGDLGNSMRHPVLEGSGTKAESLLLSCVAFAITFPKHSCIQVQVFLYFPVAAETVTPCLHAGLAGLQNLQIVDLSLNRLTGTIPSSWEAPKLVEMDLHSNALSGRVPGSLALLPRLSYLQLQVQQLPKNLQHLLGTSGRPQG